MTGEPISKGRQLYHTILGWTFIVAVLAVVAWFVWAKNHYNPERRLAGTWGYDEASRQNAGGTGQGTRLVFSGKNIDVFDGDGARIYTYDWTTHSYNIRDEGEFPIRLMLMKTENALDGFAHVMMSSDESRILFRIDVDGPTRAAEFRRLP